MEPVKRAGPTRLRIGLAAYSMRQYLQAKPGDEGRDGPARLRRLGGDARHRRGRADVLLLPRAGHERLPERPEAPLPRERPRHLRRRHPQQLHAAARARSSRSGSATSTCGSITTPQLGAPVIRVFAGVPPKDVTEEQGIQNAIANLRRACEMAATRGRDPRAREPRLPDQHRSHAADREGGRLAVVRRQPRFGQRRPAPTSTPSW